LPENASATLDNGLPAPRARAPPAKSVAASPASSPVFALAKPIAPAVVPTIPKPVCSDLPTGPLAPGRNESPVATVSPGFLTAVCTNVAPIVLEKSPMPDLPS